MAVTPLVSIIAAVTFAGNLIVHCRSDADSDVASSETSSSDSVCLLVSTQRTLLSRGDNRRQTDEELMTNVAGSLSANVVELQQLLHAQEVYQAFDGDLGASYKAAASDSNWRPSATQNSRYRDARMPQADFRLASLQEQGRAQACPVGYAFARGDVPGGDHFGRGFNNVMESITHCAGDCNGRPDCLSFEYSPTSRNCYLNKEGVPTAVLLGDTVFCTKSTPFELLEKAPNVTAAVTMTAANPEKERLITFYGRFDKVAGMALWTLIFLVMTCFLISLCWCCCCGLSLFTEGNRENLDDDEDKELHEVWVRNKK